MELFLLIGKIILIALLILLGLILLVLGLILFVPIRYEVSGSIEDSWKLQLKGKITYLLSILKVIFSYEESRVDFKVFLFGFEKKMREDNNDTTDNNSEEADITFHEKEIVQPEENPAEMAKNIKTETVSPEQTHSENKQTEQILHNESAVETKKLKQKRPKKEKQKQEKSKFTFCLFASIS